MPEETVEFECSDDEGTYVAWYRIKGGMITVSTQGGSKTTQLGNSPPLALARLIASEIKRKI